MASFSESYFKDGLPVIGWQGERYAAIGSAGRLSRILLDTEDKQTLHISELWDLGEGYTLIVKEIGAEDRVVLISLAKNGNEVYSGIVERDLRPALVVATPVGFVNDAKSKEIVRTFYTPSISCMGTRGGTPVAVAVVNELVEIVIEGKKYLMTKAAISIPRDLLKQFDCIVRGVIESIAKLQQYCSSKPGQYNKYRRQYALSTILTTALFR